MYKIKDLIPLLEEMAPLAYAEDFDNVGLLVGNLETKTTGILVCHDALESVIDEAIAKKMQLSGVFPPYNILRIEENYWEKLCRTFHY